MPKTVATKKRAHAARKRPRAQVPVRDACEQLCYDAPLVIALKREMRAGAPNSQVHPAGSEAIPYDDGAFDVVISNGVLNLSPLKEKSFREIFRVLKPHCRLQFADIVLKEDLPAEVASSLEAWSN